MARPTVALLTDFGTRDHYVGAMKGVILGICPEAALVDISHDVPPHDVLTAGFELAAAFRYFPAGAVFLVVVDPGVGTARRGLAAEAGGYRFVAPDNGVLTAAFAAEPPKRMVELTERRYARPTVSRTFEGRDRFAPGAAWLAGGVPLSALGRPLGACHRLDLPVARTAGGRITGAVVRVDTFGNLVTNIERTAFEAFVLGGDRVRVLDRPPVPAPGGALRMEVGGRPIGRLVETYADIAPDEVCAIVGSTDHLEVAASAASAADRLALGRGASVVVSRP